jgi:hypothetical protein
LDRWLGVWPELAGGAGDVDHAKPNFAPGIIELARDLFGVSLSTGTVDAIC